MIPLSDLIIIAGFSEVVNRFLKKIFLRFALSIGMTPNNKIQKKYGIIKVEALWSGANTTVPFSCGLIKMYF